MAYELGTTEWPRTTASLTDLRSWTNKHVFSICFFMGRTGYYTEISRVITAHIFKTWFIKGWIPHWPLGSRGTGYPPVISIGFNEIWAKGRLLGLPGTSMSRGVYLRNVGWRGDLLWFVTEACSHGHEQLFPWWVPSLRGSLNWTTIWNSVSKSLLSKGAGHSGRSSNCVQR